MDLGITEQTAVITGADSGIGLATAKLLAEEGLYILLTDQSADKLSVALEEVQAVHRKPDQVLACAADLTNTTAVEMLAAKALEQWGGADVLVHCAGSRGASGDFLSLSDGGWLRTIDIDLMAAVRVCRAILPQMLRKKWGRVVLISSENAMQPYPEESPYNVCKAGIVNLARCLSNAYSRKGIRINSVSPAFIATPMTDAMMNDLARELSVSEPEAVQWFLENKRPGIVTNRRGAPAEVAAVIAFLCSRQAQYITGSNYRVDGGSVSTAFG